MSRDQNISVFLDTERSCSRDKVLAAAVSKSIEAEKVIREEDAIGEVNRQIYESPATITISKKRTMEAAASYTGQRAAVVLNFASAVNPGGGVVTGASAQEEALCRVSTLYPCLKDSKVDQFYQKHRMARNPLHNDDIIYTPRVTVFKEDSAVPKRMPEDEWYNVNVITCAAPNLREHPSNQFNCGDGDECVKITQKELLALHEKRLRRILDVAVSEGNDTVVLGAFGCGAFKNDPLVVAEAVRRVLPEYLHAFEIIEFAIYCGKDDSNYKAFKQKLVEMIK